MAPYGTLLVFCSYQRLHVAAESNHVGIDKVEASNGRDSYWDPCFGKYWNDMKSSCMWWGRGRLWLAEWKGVGQWSL